MTDGDIEKRLDGKSLCKRLEEVNFDEQFDAYEIEKNYFEKMQYERDIKFEEKDDSSAYDRLELPEEKLRVAQNLIVNKLYDEKDKWEKLRDFRRLGRN